MTFKQTSAATLRELSKQLLAFMELVEQQARRIEKAERLGLSDVKLQYKTVQNKHIKGIKKWTDELGDKVSLELRKWIRESQTSAAINDFDVPDVHLEVVEKEPPAKGKKKGA